MQLFIIQVNPCTWDTDDQTYTIGVYTNQALAIKEYYNQINDYIPFEGDVTWQVDLISIPADKISCNFRKVMLSTYDTPKSVLQAELDEFLGL